MFSRGEIRLLGLASALFLAGVGWRSAQARLSLMPLQTAGTPIRWEPEASSEDSGHAIPVRRAGSTGSGKSKISGTLNPNTATVAQLTTLPGIGPALAARIAQERVREPFRTADDLERVKGIGPAKLEKIRPHILF